MMNDRWLTATVLKLIQSLVPGPPTNTRDWGLPECHGWKEQGWQQRGEITTSKRCLKARSCKRNKQTKDSLLTCGHWQRLPLNPELSNDAVKKEPLGQTLTSLFHVFILSQCLQGTVPTTTQKVCVCVYVLYYTYKTFNFMWKLKT